MMPKVDFDIHNPTLTLKKLLLHKVQQSFQTEIPLPSSKSESNRALIINALAKGHDQPAHKTQGQTDAK